MATALEPVATTSPRHLPRIVGAALVWLGTSLAIVVAWVGLSAHPDTCVGDCAAVAQSAGSTLFGVPVLAFAFGLHLTLWLVVGVRVLVPALSSSLQTVSFLLAAILLVGTATYLTWGLTLGLACTVCLTLHAAALVVALGVFLAGLGEPILAHASHRPVVFSGLVGVLVMGAGVALATSRHTSESADRQEIDTTLAAVCESETCPSAAFFRSQELPVEALTLSDSPGPTLLLWIDFDCAACRRELRAMGKLLTDWVTTRRAGLSALIRAEVSACDPNARGGDPARCEPGAALVCAARHGTPRSALEFLEWELGASAGYYTVQDRRTWLGQHVDPAAQRCLDDELRLGRQATISRHAEAAKTLRDIARTHPGCGGPDEPAWWCFAATPSMAVFSNQVPKTSAGSSPSGPTPLTIAREVALGRLTGEARAALLDTCLGGP